MTDMPVFSGDDGREYLWSDLLARRLALGLQAEESARAMKVSYEDYDEVEDGEKPPDIGALFKLLTYAGKVEKQPLLRQQT